MKNLFPLLILTILLTGCASNQLQQQQAQANAPLAAAGLITPDMAKSMAVDDATKIQQLINTSAPQDSQSWKNNVTHDMYQFTSISVSVNAAGQPCRTYQIQALIDGDKIQRQTKACRQLDGTWLAHPAASQS